MNRTEIIELITQVVGDELSLMRADVERLVALKPLPPFVPPQPWQAERLHPAGIVVRHRNGIFSARRDTTDEPPGDAWLPLLVGIAAVELAMADDRTIAMRGLLSDGERFELVHKIAVPLLRGVWSAEIEYEAGDRVLNKGEWQALQPSKGVEPGSEGSDAQWLKVGGKPRGGNGPQFALDEDGNMTEGGRAVGSIKPLVRSLLVDLVNKRR